MKSVYIPNPPSKDSVCLSSIEEHTTIFVKKDGKLVGMLNREFSRIDGEYMWCSAIDGSQAVRGHCGNQMFSTRDAAAAAVVLAGYTLWVEE